MKIPNFIVSFAFGAILAMQGWMLNEIVNLKVEVAKLSKHSTQQQTTIATNTNP